MTLSRRASTVSETMPFSRADVPLFAATIPFARAREVTIGEAFGSYVVYEKLGEGGMACVHRAELVSDGGLRKPVALKRLHTHAAEDPEFVAAFVHEAQLASKLRHPNIAQAYELGRIDNTYYIAMELVPGPTLAQVMSVSRGGAGAIPLPIALEILIQLCDALDHAHDLRDDGGRPLDLVHRDVSPMNVIISKTGIVKLIDFGIAKDRSARRETQAGIIKGKHAYVAPEYTYGQLDRRADLFGLGVVAHEMLTGRRLFVGETDVDTIRNIRTLNVPPPSRYAADVSAQLDAIVLKALERDPDLRWQNAGDMRSALTEERHRLGMAVTGRQIREWAEWAFRQAPRSDSSVDRVLHGCEPSLSVSIEIECPSVPRASAPAPALALGSGPTQQLEISESQIATIDMRTPVPARIPTLALTRTPAPARIPTPAPARTPTPAPTRTLAPARSPTPAPARKPTPAPARTPTPAPARTPTLASSPAARAKTELGRAETALAISGEPAVVAKPRRVARGPHWRPPTRWAQPPKRRSFAPLMLLALIGLAAYLVWAGYIDIERWREILEPYLG